MMIADALNSHIYHVRMEVTDTKQIPISRVCSTDESESVEFLVGKNIFQVCSTDKDKSKSIIFNEI